MALGAAHAFSQCYSPIAHLRQQGVEIVQYSDDNYIHADTFQEATQNTNTDVTLFQNLGFIIHPEKYVLNSRDHLAWFQTVLCGNVCGTYNRKGKGNKRCGHKTQRDGPILHHDGGTGHRKACSLLPSSYCGAPPLQTVRHEKSEALKKVPGNFEAKMTV